MWCNQRLSVLKLLKAFSARFLFIVHAFAAVWRVAVVYQDPVYWCLIVMVLLVISEGFMNTYFRGGDETVGFCLSVFLYLCSVVPAIWLLELDLALKRRSGLVVEELNSTITNDELSLLLKQANLLPSGLNESLWAQVIEQLLLVVLVLGRWLLPKGELSRDELSQLLLVYVGTAADIAELFETFKEPQVNKNVRVTYLILGIWSWSLTQFTIVLASNSKARRRTQKFKSWLSEDDGFEMSPSDETGKNIGDPAPFWKWFCTNLDIFGIMLSTCLQDGPFLCIRLYLLIQHHVVSYMMIFFTCKNTLVLLLQWYRLSVLVAEQIRKTRRHNKRPVQNGSVLTEITQPNISISDRTSEHEQPFGTSRSFADSIITQTDKFPIRETWIWV